MVKMREPPAGSAGRKRTFELYLLRRTSGQPAGREHGIVGVGNITVYDAIIVGSGPAGVSAAAALLDAGLNILMIDGGGKRAIHPPKSSYLDSNGKVSQQWQSFVQENFDAASAPVASSLKFKLSTIKHIFDGYAREIGATVTNFDLVGSLSEGGLSNAWGAGVACLDEKELEKFPFQPEELIESYRRVIKRIGVHGAKDDDLSSFFGIGEDLQPPPPLTAPAQRLFDRYCADTKRALCGGVTLGRARNAVLTRSLNGRDGCQACGCCLWGCAWRAIYNAAYDLDRLRKRPGFNWAGGVLVAELSASGGNWIAKGHGRRDQAPLSFSARKIVLASGTISTGAIVLRSLGLFGKKVSLLSTPSVSFAIWQPRFLFRSARQQFFGLSQLGFRVRWREDVDGFAFGNIFSADGIPAMAIVGSMPLSRALSIRLFNFLGPTLLLANCFFPGIFSNNHLSVSRDGTIAIEGNHADNLPQATRTVFRRLKRVLRRYGTFVIRSSSLALPGADVHYAGTVPMRCAPAAHECDGQGAVAGLPGVYVADGTALPHLSAKAHTLTIMANADRVARHIAALFNR